ncbi:hypothetical protein R6Q57_001965 [Mikania cordata]
MSTEKNNGPSAESETIDKLKSVVNALAMIIKDHIPNANLTSVLSSLNVEVPGVGSSPRNNSLSVNQISSSRSENDNGGCWCQFAPAGVDLQAAQVVQKATAADCTILKAGQGVTRTAGADPNIPGAAMQSTDVTKASQYMS